MTFKEILFHIDRYPEPTSETAILAMGAYARSRLREFILGGATEHILRRPKTAVFLAH